MDDSFSKTGLAYQSSIGCQVAEKCLLRCGKEFEFSAHGGPGQGLLWEGSRLRLSEVTTLLQQPPDCFWSSSENLHWDLSQLLSAWQRGAIIQTVMHEDEVKMKILLPVVVTLTNTYPAVLCHLHMRLFMACLYWLSSSFLCHFS